MRTAPATDGSQPYMSARSVPNDQPISQIAGRSSASHRSRAAATSYCSARASSKLPWLVPRGLEVPRVLKRSTAMSASAGSRQDAFLSRWLSMKPPCVGSGCRHTSVATGGRSSGSASSPTSSSPSAVCSTTSRRRAGSTVLARISGIADDPMRRLLRHP